MQYAQILVNIKSDTLDKKYSYLIPPKLLAHIGIGSLIKVPFGNQIKQGLVSNISRTVPKKIKYKLKSIKSLVFNFPIINNYQMALANKISHYYLANLAQVIFFIIPKLSSRTLKNKTLIIPKINLRSSNFQDNIYSIIDYKQNRIKHYTKLITKALQNKKSVILLFADFAANLPEIKLLARKFKNLIVFYPDEPISKKANQYLYLNQNPTLLIGTRNTIFTSIFNLGLIIIDEPFRYGFKEEQITHHHILQTAKIISQLTGCKIVIGDNVFNIEIDYQKNIKTLVTNHNIINNLAVRIINNSQNQNSIIGYQIEQLIIAKLTENKKIIIIAGQNTAASGIICAECKHLFYCPRCNKILRQIKMDDKILHCSLCSFIQNIPEKCPDCGSVKINTFGKTTYKIANILYNLFPKEKITLLKNDEDFYKHYSPDNKIFLSTKYSASWKSLSFDCAFILSWEEMLANPDYKTNITIVRSIIDLSEIIKDKIYIQTISPEDKLLNMVSSKQITNIYRDELAMRKKFGYPPFYKIIKISSKNRNEKKAKDEINKLKIKIKKIINATLNCQIIFGGKKRDKYYYSILLKIKLADFGHTHHSLYKNYQELSLSKYLIDVETERIW